MKRLIAIIALAAAIWATPTADVGQKVYAAQAPKAAPVSVQEYKVVAGDYLHKIAESHDTTWQRLFDKNTNIKDPNLIYVDEKVVIPTKDEKLESRPVEPVVAAQIEATAPTPAPVVAPTPQPAPEPVVEAVAPTPAPTPISGGKEAWMAAAGIPASEWGYVDSIVSRESGWNPNAVNASSGACGLGQQLPCGKWAGEWNDPVAALVAQHGYVVARYGSYAGAVAFWNANHWY